MNRLIALLGVVIVVAIGGYLYMQQDSGPANPLANAASAEEAADVDTSSIVEMTMGDENAPVTVVEYASFACPHCAVFHEGAFKQLKADYIDTGKVHFTYREVYFDRYGLWASMIARCAGPEKFFGIADLIYAGQSTWSRAGDTSAIVDELRKIGRLAGIENDAMEACLQDGDRAQTLVAWYQKNAAADGIEATPSFVINGTTVVNVPWDQFSAMIDAELAN